MIRSNIFGWFVLLVGWLVGVVFNLWWRYIVFVLLFNSNFKNKNNEKKNYFPKKKVSPFRWFILFFQDIYGQNEWMNEYSIWKLKWTGKKLSNFQQLNNTKINHHHIEHCWSHTHTHLTNKHHRKTKTQEYSLHFITAINRIFSFVVWNKRIFNSCWNYYSYYDYNDIVIKNQESRISITNDKKKTQKIT